MGGWSTSAAETAQQFCEKARQDYKRLGGTRSDLSNTISLMHRIFNEREARNIDLMSITSLEAALAKRYRLKDVGPHP